MVRFIRAFVLLHHEPLLLEQFPELGVLLRKHVSLVDDGPESKIDVAVCLSDGILYLEGRGLCGL